MKRFLSTLISLFLVGSLLVGCTKENNNKADNPNTDPVVTSEPADITAAPDSSDSSEVPSQSGISDSASDISNTSDSGDGGQSAADTSASATMNLYFSADGSWAFNSVNKIYDDDVTIDIFVPEGATVYYTTDGSEPTTDSFKYTDRITLEAHGGSFPHSYSFRAKAFFADGTKSDTAARNILASTKLDGRYSTLIFCVSGNPDELINSPDGIFADKNYEERGRESEREIYLDVFRADGSSAISQYAGVRIYGGYSRQSTMKSMKLFARKEYDADHKNFKLNDFGTLKLDGSNDIISKYSKLVLRNSGNDFQFAFIRDELSQVLVQKAGFECYEAVLPAICYLNGEYYGFFWLHENYCDKYFKEKYGDAEGEFYVLEGGEREKADEDDPVAQKLVADYNAHYNRFIKMDLTNDANFRQVRDYLDVESYLDFFAWNIALNNWDWPNNNYKLFRYVEASSSVLNADGAVATPDSEVFDGRWRFLPHDMDYTYGLYDQNITQANYNTLKVVMNKNDERYAPLFVKLMERSDCRSYFRAKTMEYINGALSEESIVESYEELHATRLREFEYFYKYMEQENRKGNTDFWTGSNTYLDSEKDIYDFAKKRGSYVIKYMDKLLPEL